MAGSLRRPLRTLAVVAFGAALGIAGATASGVGLSHAAATTAETAARGSAAATIAAVRAAVPIDLALPPGAVERVAEDLADRPHPVRSSGADAVLVLAVGVAALGAATAAGAGRTRVAGPGGRRHPGAMRAPPVAG